MQKSTFNFATVFSLMVLLVFTYITYLGLVYWKQGAIMLPIILSVALIAIVMVCVFIMCKSKTTRWRRIGRTGQWVFGFIVLITFVSASIPFTNFLRVASDSDKINKMVNVTCDKAISIDQNYETYVNQRVENYAQSLQLIANGKSNRPSLYNECMSKAPGDSDDKKIENLTKSLRARLLPDSASTIVKERHDWLEKAKNESVMNPLTPANINKVSQCVDNWVLNYKELSKVEYQGEENVQEFNIPEFNNSLLDLTTAYGKLQSPSILAIIIAFVCFGIMLLPYWITEGDLAAATSTSKSTYKNLNLGKSRNNNNNGNLFSKNGN